MRLTLLFFFVMLALIGNGQNSYFVSTIGEDKNDGSINAPWKSIQRGCFELKPGDTLNLLEGKYEEKFYLENSGSEGKMITIKAFKDDTVIIDGDTFSDDLPLFYAGNTSYFRVEGLHFKHNYHPSGVAFYINGYGHYIEVINCTFSDMAISKDPNFPITYNTNHPVVSFGGDSPDDSLSNILVHGIEIYNCRPGYSECLTLGGNITDFEFSNNHIHHNANIGIDAGGNYKTTPTKALDHARRGLIKNNHCHHNISAYSTAAGIYIDGGHDIIVENNILHHNDYGIEIGCEETGNTKNIIARNNLIYLNRHAGMSLGGYDESTGGYVTNAKVLNNTFYHNDVLEYGNGEILFTQFEDSEVSNNIFYLSNHNYYMSNDLMQPNLVMEYNLVYNKDGKDEIQGYIDDQDEMGLSNIYTVIGGAKNNIYGDPLFNDIAKADFHLKDHSPAIDMGDPNYIVSMNEMDIDQQIRVFNGRIDCGADEFNSIILKSDANKISSISIHPNPFINQLTVEGLNDHSSSEFNIYNSHGQLIRTGKVKSNNPIIDMFSLPADIYSIEIENQILRLIKIK